MRGQQDGVVSVCRCNRMIICWNIYSEYEVQDRSQYATLGEARVDFAELRAVIIALHLEASLVEYSSKRDKICYYAPLKNFLRTSADQLQ